MTRQAKNNYACLFCQVDLVCPLCRKTRKMGTPFSLWLRQLSAPLTSRTVYNSDIDHVWWHYKDGWLITIEEKQYGADIKRPQQELIDIVSERLSGFTGITQKTLRGVRPVQYRGHYNIIFEKTCPTDSQWIRINKQTTSIEQLMILLSTGNLSLPLAYDYDIDELVANILPTFI